MRHFDAGKDDAPLIDSERCDDSPRVGCAIEH
jgi:hypothetical protein